MNIEKIIKEIVSSAVLVVITIVFLGVGTMVSLNQNTYTRIASAEEPQQNSQKISAIIERASAESISSRTKKILIR